MSAPHQGRQSPDPERQSGAQKDAPGSGNIGAGDGDKSKEISDDQKDNVLESNPVGPMEDAAQEKVSKESITKG
ncbi:MAG: hypothetical protein M1827_005811 [Pycnora praestabilis]|nr:MAG: hypothetical protein M1827_005811 [Pycnora praestabilis]